MIRVTKTLDQIHVTKSVWGVVLATGIRVVRGISYNSSQRPPWFPWHRARHCNVQSHTPAHNRVEITPKANRVQSHTHWDIAQSNLSFFLAALGLYCISGVPLFAAEGFL